MRDHGESILQLTSLLGLTRLRNSVIVPALADMRQECAEARPGSPRMWAIVRGYSSILTAVALFAWVQPARSVCDDWSTFNAGGPRLLLRTLRPTVVASAFLLVIGLVNLPRDPRLGLDIAALQIPSLLCTGIPLATAVGVAWTLTRSGSATRGAIGVGLIAVAFSFAFFEGVVVEANQAYRQAAFNAILGRATPLARGSREMRLADLTRAANSTSVATCPLKATGCSCGQSPSAEFLRTEWHNRFTIPGLAFPFVLLAVMLSRCGRRRVAIPALFLTYGGTMTLLRLSEASGIRGEIPIALAAWSPCLLPFALAFVAHMLTWVRIARTHAA